MSHRIPGMMPERSCRWIVLLLVCCALTPFAASGAVAARKNAELDRAERLLHEWLNADDSSVVIVRDPGHLTLRIPVALVFQADSASLKQDAVTSAPLAATLRLLKRRRALSARIVVYTDSIGDQSSNLSFSQRRADTLSDALKDAGIARPRLQSQGAGEAQALGDNETAEGRQQNRRLEIAFQRAGVVQSGGVRSVPAAASSGEKSH